MEKKKLSRRLKKSVCERKYDDLMDEYVKESKVATMVGSKREMKRGVRV